MENESDYPAETAATVFPTSSKSSTTEATTITSTTVHTVVTAWSSCGNIGIGDTLSPDSHWVVVGIVVVSTVLLLVCGYQFFKNRKSLWMPNRGV